MAECRGFDVWLRRCRRNEQSGPENPCRKSCRAAQFRRRSKGDSSLKERLECPAAFGSFRCLPTSPSPELLPRRFAIFRSKSVPRSFSSASVQGLHFGSLQGMPSCSRRVVTANSVRPNRFAISSSGFVPSSRSSRRVHVLCSERGAWRSPIFRRWALTAPTERPIWGAIASSVIVPINYLVK